MNYKYFIRKLICNKSINVAFYHHKVSSLFPGAYSDFRVKNDETKLETTQEMINKSGIFSNVAPGLFCILPLGLRSMRKLEKLIDSFMDEIGAQRISMPLLIPSSLWKKSGRYKDAGEEVGKFIDRHDQEYILSPTHEEAVTNLLSKAILPSAQIPLRLYQVSTKFRDEIRLKLGLIRGREFTMKDLYTFDKSIEDANRTYQEVLHVYDNLFSALNLNTIRVEASVGMIGGSLSHEFHIPLKIGEDNLFKCNACSSVLCDEFISTCNIETCHKCGGKLEQLRGLEIAHAFILGDKYSKALSAFFKNHEGKNRCLQMGCYGIGLSRLLAGTLEHLSDSTLKWPEKIVPFRVCLIPPKKGSKEEKSTDWSAFLESTINEISGYRDDVIVDDRVKLTIGRRLDYAKFMGFPIIIVVGKESISDIPVFELHNTINNTMEKFNHLQIVNYLSLRG